MNNGDNETIQALKAALREALSDPYVNQYRGERLCKFCDSDWSWGHDKDCVVTKFDQLIGESE